MARPWRNRLLVAGAALSLIAGVSVSASAMADTTSPNASSSTSDDDGTAAGKYDWGKPIPEGSDEFDYGTKDKPVPANEDKWSLAGGGVDQCGPGHDDNGQRCDKNTRVDGEVLRQTGEANGDSGWVGSKFGQQYGRWEARVRSEPKGGEKGDKEENAYHPLLILWPDSDQWPEDGEYDYLENTAPGEDCAQSYIHYPHNADADTQQEFGEKCGVDLTKWHNVAIEWTADHVKGFIDGEEWFSYSGGENDIRKCIQCAPSMHQTIQLDNFAGDGMQEATYEVDWVHAYKP